MRPARRQTGFAATSFLAASDVLGTGWFGAVAAEVGPGKTVAVVGDGAVGLLGVLAAQQLGAERIIIMSRHESRQGRRSPVRDRAWDPLMNTDRYVGILNVA
mgnify:CR=1 FL=1